MNGGIDCIATDGSTRLPMGIGGAITVTAAGNVGIGTSTPNNILHVGDGGKLRISNGISD